MHARALTRREFLVAGIVRVVHKVVDRIETGLAGAGIASGRTSARGAGLGGGIGNKIAAAGAASLESVVQTKPVADFVRDGIAEVEVGLAAARNGRVQDAAPIKVKVVGTASHRLGEVAVPKVAADGALEVNVQCPVGPLAEGLLHGQLGTIAGPVGVDGEVGAFEGKGEAMRGKSVLENLELI